MKYVIIPADHTKPIEIRETTALTYEDLNAGIGGGYIERVRYHRHDADRHLDLWLDEDGKSKDLPLNNRATMIAHHGESIFPQDTICGDVVVTGPANADGESQGITDEAQEWLEGLSKAFMNLLG